MTLLADPVISQTLALALALLFGGAGWHKWRDQAAFAEVLRRYDALPTRVLPVAVRLIPMGELLLAVTLLWPGTHMAALFVSAALLGLYGGVIAQGLARGRRLDDCGCGWGNDASHSVQAARWALVWRNALLALIVLAVAFSSAAAARTPGLLDRFTIVMGAAVAALLYALSNQLIANHYRHREIFHD